MKARAIFEERVTLIAKLQEAIFSARASGADVSGLEGELAVLRAERDVAARKLYGDAEDWTDPFGEGLCYLP